MSREYAAAYNSSVLVFGCGMLFGCSGMRGRVLFHTPSRSSGMWRVPSCVHSVDAPPPPLPQCRGANTPLPRGPPPTPIHLCRRGAAQRCGSAAERGAAASSPLFPVPPVGSAEIGSSPTPSCHGVGRCQRSSPGPVRPVDRSRALYSEAVPEGPSNARARIFLSVLRFLPRSCPVGPVGSVPLFPTPLLEPVGFVSAADPPAQPSPPGAAPCVGRRGRPCRSGPPNPWHANAPPSRHVDPSPPHLSLPPVPVTRTPSHDAHSSLSQSPFPLLFLGATNTGARARGLRGTSGR